MMRLKASQLVKSIICDAFSNSKLNYWTLLKGIWSMGKLALLGETRVLSVDSAFGLNATHTPPVSGALGEIGL
jgi:hypothetical protein